MKTFFAGSSQHLLDGIKLDYRKFNNSFDHYCATFGAASKDTPWKVMIDLDVRYQLHSVGIQFSEEVSSGLQFQD